MFIAMNDEGIICGTGKTGDEAADDAVRQWSMPNDTKEERAEYRSKMNVHPATLGLINSVDMFGGDPDYWAECGIGWNMTETGVFFVYDMMEN